MNRFLPSILSLALLATLSLDSAAQVNPRREIKLNDKVIELKPTKAVVEFSANLMREAPDFAAELGDQALMGTVVEILDRDGYWVKIKTPEPYTAWVTDLGLVEMIDKEIDDYLEAPKYICTASVSHIYEEPSVKSRIVSEFILGDVVRINLVGGGNGDEGQDIDDLFDDEE